MLRTHVLEAAAVKFFGALLLFCMGLMGKERGMGKDAGLGNVRPTCCGLRATTAVATANKPKRCEKCITNDMEWKKSEQIK